MTWKIEIADSAAKDLAKLDKAEARRIVVFLRERAASLEDPRTLGHPLKGPRFGGYWRYRVGDYRIICDISHETVTILVLRVGNRREVHR